MQSTTPTLLLPARAESLIPKWERYSQKGKDTPRSRWEAHNVAVLKAAKAVRK